MALFLAAAPPRCAARIDATTVKANLQQRYRETNSLTAHFSEKIQPVGAPARTRSGTLYLAKPGRMRWEFESPEKELLVSDGTTVFSYDPGLNQVVETPLKQALQAPGATEFLLGAGDVVRDFTGTLGATGADGLLHLTLTPRRGGDTTELTLDPNSYDIRALQITDQLGNVTSIAFSDLKKNTPIEETLFKFSPPPGADIVGSGTMK